MQPRSPRVTKYDVFRDAIHKAGFFTNGVEVYEDFDRTCVCSKKLPHGIGLSGNSFWVSLRGPVWYIGTWGGLLYRMKDQDRLVEMCIAWLTRVPSGTRSDFDDALKAEFGLIEVSDAEFDSASCS
jgi:hypothetical protein